MNDNFLDTVMLVVDTSWLRSRMSALRLHAVGARVLLASNYAQALRVLNEHQVEIALIDADQGGSGAQELVALIRAEMPSVYCVAVSDADGDSELEAFFAQGFDDFLPRPMRTARLRALMVAARDASHEMATQRERHSAEEDESATIGLRDQLLDHLREETDRLVALSSDPNMLRGNLRRWMHRIRSGLLLMGYRALADECLDLERDCELAHIAEAVLKRRAWRIARQLRILCLGYEPVAASAVLARRPKAVQQHQR